MRPPIEKPSDTGMRYFTPDLYVRFNSSNEEEANRADEAWEEALQEYQRHLKSIWDKLPSQVRKLTELCLHDAELLACRLEIEPLPPFAVEPYFPGAPWSAVALLSLKSGERITTLIYGLWDRLREIPPDADWPFSKDRKHWLYDEVDGDVNRRGIFVHRALFSDGSVLEIPFVSTIIHRFAL